jgi:hypothetical protein
MKTEVFAYFSKLFAISVSIAKVKETGIKADGRFEILLTKNISLPAQNY